MATITMMRILVFRPDVDFRMPSSRETEGSSNIVLSSMALESSWESPTLAAEESSSETCWDTVVLALALAAPFPTEGCTWDAGYAPATLAEVRPKPT